MMIYINELVFQTNKFAKVKTNDDEGLKVKSCIKKMATGHSRRNVLLDLTADF